MLPATLATLLFSISVVCATRTAKMLGSAEANFWRLAFAMFCLALWAHGFGVGIAGKSLPIFLLSGFIGFGVGDLALFQALPLLGSRLSILLVHCLAAPFAALTEWLWLGTTLSLFQVVSSVTILAGVALALAPSDHLKLTRRQFRTGIGFGVLAAIGQAFGAVLSRKAFALAAATHLGIDGITAAYQRILGGMVVATFWYWWTRRGAKSESGTIGADTPKPVAHRWRAAWPWVLLNGLTGSALGVSCFQWALKTAPTGVVLPIVAMTPLVVIPLARVMEGEQATLRSLVGGVIAVAGVIALTLAK